MLKGLSVFDTLEKATIDYPIGYWLQTLELFQKWRISSKLKYLFYVQRFFEQNNSKI